MTNHKISHQTPIAIVGMGCLFPESPGLKAYQRLLFQGIDAITDVPDTHWSSEDFYDSDPKKPDHVYCKRGGFIPRISFDPTEFGIPPSSLEATDTSQLLGLLVAKKALEDATIGTHKPFNRDKTSVILGVTGTQELVIPLGSRLGHPIWRNALEQSGIDPQKTEEIIQKISDAYVPWRENSFPGLLGNVVAGRICNRLDLGGTNCVVDAACASSMSAIHLAVMELISNRSDMVITGGVDMLNDIFMHMCFSKTMVLSPTGDVRPFSKDADGTVLGEGIGLFVLKRLEDAQRDGNRIYAVIKGVGSSSDGKSQSIYAPRVQGQIKALRSAYDDAGIDPATVELIEAHGTGTQVGDEVEFQALRRFFGESDNGRPWCALGSVKSMIGHTKAAAGAAGLMKAVLAVYHKVLPPTLKVREPDPKLNIHQSPFYLNSRTRPWFSKETHPRRAGISAFGFGGSNFHVVIEEYQEQKQEISWDGSKEIVAFSALNPNQLKLNVEHFKTLIDDTTPYEAFSAKAAKTRHDFSAGDPYRFLLVMGPSTDMADLLNRAICALETNPPQETWQLENMFYGGPEPPGKTAFIFPGQGSQYVNMGRDLMAIFPDAMKVLEQADQAFKSFGRLTDFIYPLSAQHEKERQRQEKNLRKTDIAQPAIGAVSMAMLKILQNFGIQPDAVCGHSYGELSALCAAGWIHPDTFLNLSMTRGRLMAATARKDNGNNGGMLAVKAPLDEIENLIKDMKADIILANRNSPTQGVLSGAMEALFLAEKQCKEKGYQTLRLPVSAAFHSPLVRDAQEPFLQALKKIDILPSGIPVFSNTTGSPYPVEPEKAKKLLGDHLLSSVDFMGEINQLFKMGVRTFVEVGPKSVLTGLVRSILEGRNFHAVSLDGSLEKGSGITDLVNTVSFLASLGHHVDLTAWEQQDKYPKKQRMSIPLSGANYREQRSETQVRNVNVSHRKTEIGKQIPAVGNHPSGNRRSPINTQPSNHPSERSVSHPEITNIRSRDVRKNQNIMKNKQPQNNIMLDALHILQDGLKSIQALQKQTAETHQKFLESQTQASRTLQHMMENTQRLVENSLGIQSVMNSSDILNPIKENIPDIKKPPEDLYNNSDDLKSRDSRIPADHLKVPDVSDKDPLEVPEEPSMDNAAGNAPTSAKDGQKDIEKTMLETVSRLTGYPVEMLDMDMDIEADLGIDSIKRVEILSALEEKMPDLPAVSPDIMGSLKTLGQIAEYLSENSETQLLQPCTSCSSSDSLAKPVSTTLDTWLRKNSDFSSEYLMSHIGRNVVSAVKTPFVQKDCLSFPDKRTIYVTDDKSGLSQAIVDQFKSRNIPAEIIPDNMVSHGVDIESHVKNAAGLIIVAPPEPQDDAFLKQTFFLAKHFGKNLLDSTEENRTLFATITRLDGAFGFKGRGVNDPLQGGLAGLVKTAAIEWENVHCRAIDIAPDWQDESEIAKAAVAELLNFDPSGPIEIGLNSDSRWILELKSAPYPQGDINLDPKDVLVVTGGARGVTAAAACALAEHVKPTLILMGRTTPPMPEPKWISGIHDPSALKKAILDNEFSGNAATPIQLEKIYKKYMAHREIAQNLEIIRNLGTEVYYYSVDVRDADRVNAVLNDVRKTHGPIKGIIHGAGILADCRIIDKSSAQFENVFNTKVKGLQALLDATRMDELKYLVLFSSVTARVGNNGQADYAMANEVLNKMAQNESIQRPDCRVISINWGPWDGGMVCSALKRKFKTRGINLIPMDAGVMCMIHEMKGDKASPVEVIIGADLLSEPKDVAETAESLPEPPMNLKKKEPLSLTVQREIDVDRYPILGAHILDGKPVVPFALITEWLGHGALHENPGLLLHGLEDMRIFQGIKLDQKKKCIRLMAGKARKKGGVFEVDVQIRNGINDNIEMIHSGATAILTDRLASPPAFDLSAHIGTNGYSKTIHDIYENILFHGVELQGIQEIIGYSSQSITARIASAPSPAEWMKEPLRSRWIADPLVLDSACQMAILWCFEEWGVVSLPSYSAGYRQYRDVFPSGGVIVVLEIREAIDHKIKGDFTFLDAHEVVVARMTGYEAVMDESLSKAFKSQHAAA